MLCRFPNLWQLIVARNCTSTSSSTCSPIPQCSSLVRCSFIRLPISSSIQPLECTSLQPLRRILNQWYQRSRRWQVSGNDLIEKHQKKYAKKHEYVTHFFVYFKNFFRYPAGVNPSACPNYPYCDTGAHGSYHVPQVAPLPGYNARNYPAGVNPASCPNYPYCA